MHGAEQNETAGWINKEEFDVRIYPEARKAGINWKELWRYKDMVKLFVRRDFISGYKQTVLGPTWAIINPLVSTLVTAVVFGNMAELSPAGVPVFLFYMSGQLLWSLFSSLLNNTTNVFLNGAYLMGKVYFPRFLLPIAGALSVFISFLIQVALFAIIYFGYMARGIDLTPHPTAALIPLYILHLVILGMGVGAILSSLTTKYRDLSMLVSYGVSFWMYISPIVYDYAIVPDGFRALYLLNPASPIIIHIRYALFQDGQPFWPFYGISLAVTVLLFAIGNRVFHRVERTFLDTI